jgi:hypothetical protein
LQGVNLEKHFLVTAPSAAAMTPNQQLDRASGSEFCLYRTHSEAAFGPLCISGEYSAPSLRPRWMCPLGARCEPAPKLKYQPEMNCRLAATS